MKMIINGTITDSMLRAWTNWLKELRLEKRKGAPYDYVDKELYRNYDRKDS